MLPGSGASIFDIGAVSFEFEIGGFGIGETSFGLTGTYRISNGRIDFVWGGARRRKSSPLAIKTNEIEFLGAHWFRAETDPRKQPASWLLGSFRRQTGGPAGGVSPSVQSWCTFRSDGAFETAACSAATTNAPVPQANRGHTGRASGTTV
jgi:hypothetical protein